MRLITASQASRFNQERPAVEELRVKELLRRAGTEKALLDSVYQARLEEELSVIYDMIR